MITWYEFSGRVRGCGRKVTATVSAPLGVSIEEFGKRVLAFLTAFEEVSIRTSPR